MDINFTIADYLSCLVPLVVGILMIVGSFFDEKNKDVLRKGGFIALIVTVFIVLKHIFI